MSKAIRFCSALLVFTILFGCVFIKSKAQTFEESLLNFPASYHSYLRQLHEKYPNWKFIAVNHNLSFDQAVDKQYLNKRKHVELSQGIAWRSLQKDAYDWTSNNWKIYDSDRWVAASREVIAYYMDPRNFLDNTHIYMFLKQSYDPSTQNREGLAQIISGTFLANPYTPTTVFDANYGGSYLEVIMAAAQESGVNPYIIASKIITEQGRNGTSGLISGNYAPEYQGYYNFFNWGASGIGNDAVVRSGLATAVSEGWNSRAASIIGGAKKLANNYIGCGQDTYYYMAFNLIDNREWHQYESAIYAAYNKARNVAGTYSENTNAALEFRIPVFTSIPDTLATKAEKGDNRYNNYYLTAMTADNVNIPFDMYTQNYSFSISGDTTICVKTFNSASIISQSQFGLSAGSNTVNITVQSESGFTNNYTLNINAATPCTLIIANTTPSTSVSKADANGDGTIDAVDLAAIRLYMLGKLPFDNDMITRADINGDTVVDAIDLAGVRLYLLGKISF